MDPSASTARRKRLLDEFQSRPFLVGGVGHDRDEEQDAHPHRASLVGLSSSVDLFADVHSGLQMHSNMSKSRRIVSEPPTQTVETQSPVVGPIGSRDVLAPLSAAGSPGPSLMSEPLGKSSSGLNPFLPTSFSSSHLENFRLDNNNNNSLSSGSNNNHNGEQKENKARVSKPVPKRSIHATAMNTPRMQPSLPALSQFLSPKDPPRNGSTLQRGVFASVFSKLSSSATSLADGPNGLAPWRPSVLSKRDGLAPVAAQTPPSTIVESKPISHPVVNGGLGTDSDQCSSDEEFSMENEISLSQDKLNSLSVHDILESDLIETGNQEDARRSEKVIGMQLTDGFASMLSEQEEKALRESGVFTIDLQQPSPIIMGRDQFYTVFGEKIRGFETFHLSRRHCLFHVKKPPSKELGADILVSVENTSTNGLEVNGRPLKHGERRDLQIGDVVTLLKIRNHGDDNSLAYVMTPVQQSQRMPSAEPAQTASLVRSHFVNLEKNGNSFQGLKVPYSTNCSKASSKPSSPVKPKMGFPSIQVNVLIADPFTVSADTTPQISRGYREELMATMSAFAAVDRLKVSYDCATKDTLLETVKNESNIVLYAGGSEESRILVEDLSGMPSHFDHNHLSSAVCLAADGCKSKIVIAFAKSIATAQLFVDSGFAHVLFVNSSESCRSKSICYLRALLSCLLQGSSLHRSHVIARRTALGSTSNVLPSADCLCGILPGGQNHDIGVGDVPVAGASGPMSSSNLSILNAFLIPTLTPHFLGRENAISEVIGSLRRTRVQVCMLKGGKGVGKSSIAVYVAKYATDRRWYKCGVHYIDIEAELDSSDVDSNSIAIGLSDEYALGNERRRGLSRKVQCHIEDLLQQIQRDSNAAEASALLVLDGCDGMNPPQFRDYVVKMVQEYPGVQVLITMRQDMKINVHSKIVDECMVHIKELPPAEAATLFVAIAKACIDQDRLKQVLPSDSPDKIVEHPALARLKGNPLLISRLAMELKHSSLAELE